LHKTYIIITLLSSVLVANFITVHDENGSTIDKKDITHIENGFLNQDEKEYSLQAFYRELQIEKVKAINAMIAKRKAEEIQKKEELAKEKNKTYVPTKGDKEILLEYAKYFKGGKYIWGGTTPEGFDCSGYVQYLYKKQNVNMPRTAWEQSKIGIEIPKNELKKGDLVFFLTDKSRKIPVTHVGIYMGDNQFIHAASKAQGIIISPLDSGSYADTFVKATRVF
jgi:cell wall-associated NlpC family hydrolase